MTDFDYEVKERKKIARQAKYKRNGSKSKKCSLLSDGMTRAEWKRRCGEVESVALNKPIEWTTFKKLNRGLQEEYINHLRSEYNASVKDIGDMFGVNQTTISAYITNHDINVKDRKSKSYGIYHSAPEIALKWRAFIGGSETDDVKIFEHVDDCIESATEEKSNATHCTTGEMTNFSVCFSGNLNIDNISNSLRLILGHDFNGMLSINYESE